MLIDKNIREQLDELFKQIKLKGRCTTSLDNQVKIEQILAYLEIVHSEVRKISRRRKLVFIDSAAGNCYLSYLVYYYYQQIDKREIEIHCIDTNGKLMESNTALSKELGFSEMHFHVCDITEFYIDKKVDLVFSLHACDTATDKTMYLGIRAEARIILSVACCQNSLKLKSKRYNPVIRHKSFRDKILMMVSDSLRAMLLEKEGYKVNIFDFVSSRYTDKNVMVRAVRKGMLKSDNTDDGYNKLSSEFRIKPYLESLLLQEV